MDIRTQVVLEHMLEDSLDIEQFIKEIDSPEALSVNKLYRKAVIMSILNIGESVKNLPQEFKVLYSEIPWKKIAGIRDVAAHKYYTIEDEIVWTVAKDYLPDLTNFLQKQLNLNN